MHLWPMGQAMDCKPIYVGSIPTKCSILYNANEYDFMSKQTNKQPEYNWRQLKINYLLSDFTSLQAWARDYKEQHPGSIPADNNASFYRNTKGWSEDKKEMHKKEVNLTVDKVIKENATRNAKMYKVFLTHLYAQLLSAEYLEPGDLKNLWHMLRVESGLVTNIAKNENENKNTDFNAVRKEMLESAKDEIDDEDTTGDTDEEAS